MSFFRALVTDLIGAAVPLQKASVTLTNAQIKALPSTPITLVAAPGANLRIKPIAAFLRTDTVAGAYTNINATLSELAIYWLGDFTQWAMTGIVNDSGASPAPTSVSSLLGSAGILTTDLVPYVDAFGNGWVIPSIVGQSTTANKALAIAMDNNGSGALTGGNAANTMTATVYYTIETV